MSPGGLRHLPIKLLVALLATPAAAQVLEIGEDGSVRPAPGISGQPFAQQEKPALETLPRAAGQTSAQTAAAGLGPWLVQLGAYGTLSELEADWQSIRQRHAPLLRRHMIVRTQASVDGRNYHRLSIAGLPDRHAALALCRELRRSGRDCYVRHGSTEQTGSRQ